MDELEVRLNKKIERLQAQINAMSAELRKLYRVVTHPSTKTYLQKYSVLKSEVGDLLGTADQVVVTNGLDCMAKSGNVILSLPAAVTGKLVTNGDSHDHSGGDGGAIPLTTGVVGILPSANGGTGNGFAKLSGPSAAEKTFTLPDADAKILTDNALVTSAEGGTGNGFTKFTGPTIAEKVFTLPDANAVIATVSGVTPASTGVGSVKMGSANPADNAGWLAITNHLGALIYVPYWTDETP